MTIWVDLPENNLQKNNFLSKKVIFCIGTVFGILILFNFLFLNAPKDFPTGQIISVEQGKNLREISNSD